MVSANDLILFYLGLELLSLSLYFLASIDRDSIIAGVKETIQGKKIDMVFISCTSIRFLDFVPQLEELIGIPVTTSNHAMAWHCMRLGGVKNTLPNLGQLFLK